VQRYLLVISIFLSMLILSGCYANRDYKFNYDLGRESWMHKIDRDTSRWAWGTDPWFLSGDAYATEAPLGYGALSTLKVSARDFSGIKANGDFKVQIFGTDKENTVYVYGPTEAVAKTIATVKGNTLYLGQREKASPALMRQVIIRIGVHRLNHLVQYGRGMIEGIRLGCEPLRVISVGSGNVYLAGHMKVTELRNIGRGTVSLFGVNTPELDIQVAGIGTTNVSGKVGVRSIVHHDSACLNIIGANSDGLKIEADGSGKIGIAGAVNLCLLRAAGNVRVYVCGVNSESLHVYANQRARIGLAGVAHRFYVDAYQDTYVAARDLCTDEAYIRADDRAHVNVAAARKIFATSSGGSSIYYFGQKEILTRFVSGSGFVMQMCAQESSCSMLQKQPCPELVGAG
jgi:hypothetical protein